MRILVGPGLRPGEPRQIMRVILFGERGVEAIAAMNDRGAFVSVTPPVEESASQEDGAGRTPTARTATPRRAASGSTTASTRRR